MQELFNLGISDEDIKSMIELNPDIKELTNKEIINKINLLSSIGCTNSQITHIFITNSLCFNRTDEGILKLIKYLLEKGFNCINLLFESNPYILNLEAFEVENYINKRLDKGESLEDIVDDLDSNPYLFNEM